MKKHFFALNLIVIFGAFFTSKLAFAQLGFCNGNSGEPISINPNRINLVLKFTNLLKNKSNG